MLSMPQIDLSERRYGGCTFSPDFDGTLQQAREGEQGSAVSRSDKWPSFRSAICHPPAHVRGSSPARDSC